MYNLLLTIIKKLVYLTFKNMEQHIIEARHVTNQQLNNVENCVAVLHHLFQISHEKIMHKVIGVI